MDKSKSAHISFDTEVSDKQKLIVLSVMRLKLDREVEDHVLFDGDCLDDSRVKHLKEQVIREFYYLLQDFIEVEFIRGRFGYSNLRANISMPYIKGHLMKGLESSNNSLRKVNDDLLITINKFKSMTAWDFVKAAFRGRL